MALDDIEEEVGQRCLSWTIPEKVDGEGSHGDRLRRWSTPWKIVDGGLPRVGTT
jgi:hypothetical protein